MAGVILSITVLAIGSITPTLAFHSSADLTVEISHAKRGILASGEIFGAPCDQQLCLADIDIDNDKQIKRIIRLCGNKTFGSVAVGMTFFQVSNTKICTQGPFTVTIVATIHDVPHGSSVVVVSVLT